MQYGSNHIAKQLMSDGIKFTSIVKMSFNDLKYVFYTVNQGIWIGRSRKNHTGTKKYRNRRLK